jgi:hypothetical protein
LSDFQPIDLDDLRRVAVKVRWMTDDNWLADMVEIAAAEIARLRDERRWVPVGERLPEDNVAVLAWGPCNGGAEMVWREQGKWRLSYVGTHVPDVTYTHWMPLPDNEEGGA